MPRPNKIYTTLVVTEEVHPRGGGLCHLPQHQCSRSASDLIYIPEYTIYSHKDGVDPIMPWSPTGLAAREINELFAEQRN